MSVTGDLTNVPAGGVSRAAITPAYPVWIAERGGWVNQIPAGLAFYLDPWNVLHAGVAYDAAMNQTDANGNIAWVWFPNFAHERTGTADLSIGWLDTAWAQTHTRPFNYPGQPGALTPETDVTTGMPGWLVSVNDLPAIQSKLTQTARDNNKYANKASGFGLGELIGLAALAYGGWSFFAGGGSLFGAGTTAVEAGVDTAGTLAADGIEEVTITAPYMTAADIGSYVSVPSALSVIDQTAPDLTSYIDSTTQSVIDSAANVPLDISTTAASMLKTASNQFLKSPLSALQTVAGAYKMIHGTTPPNYSTALQQARAADAALAARNAQSLSSMLPIAALVAVALFAGRKQ